MLDRCPHYCVTAEAFVEGQVLPGLEAFLQELWLFFFFPPKKRFLITLTRVTC